MSNDTDWTRPMRSAYQRDIVVSCKSHPVENDRTPWEMSSLRYSADCISGPLSFVLLFACVLLGSLLSAAVLVTSFDRSFLRGCSDKSKGSGRPFRFEVVEVVFEGPARGKIRLVFLVLGRLWEDS